RSIAGVGNQYMVARLDQRQQGDGDCGKSRRYRQSRMASFESRERLLHIAHGRQPMQAVDEPRMLTAFRELEIRNAVEKNSRCSVDRRIDGTEMPGWIASQVCDRSRRPLLRSIGHVEDLSFSPMAAP